jgi:hypothetical protein
MNDGFYLVDSLDRPFESKYTGKQKEALLKEGQAELLNKIKRLLSDDAKVI